MMRGTRPNGRCPKCDELYAVVGRSHECNPDHSSHTGNPTQRRLNEQARKKDAERKRLERKERNKDIQ